MSTENDMNPFPYGYPADFLMLTPIETMLISPAYPFMKVYTFANGATGFRGQILNVQQDISDLVKHFNEVHSLPIDPSDLPLLLIRKPNASPLTGNDKVDCFKVCQSAISKVLYF
jgi:hypothetical protein